MPNDTREQRLAAKLRENLKRRKVQAKARSAATGGKPQADIDEIDESEAPRAGASLKPDADSDS